jgi:hypothetical protein
MISHPLFTMTGPASMMPLPAEKLKMPQASQPRENKIMAKKSKARKSPAKKTKRAGKKK